MLLELEQLFRVFTGKSLFDTAKLVLPVSSYEHNSWYWL
jgi:hypothetical protein